MFFPSKIQTPVLIAIVIVLRAVFLVMSFLFKRSIGRVEVTSEKYAFSHSVSVQYIYYEVLKFIRGFGGISGGSD